MPTTAALRLLDALREPGCAVCRCLEADARQDLAAWLREQTMDPDARAALRQEGGLCAWHTAMLREAADGILSVALLARDLLGDEGARRAARARRDRCARCVALEPRQEGYLRACLTEPDAHALRGALARGPGLVCRPHLVGLGPIAGRRAAALTALGAVVGERRAHLVTRLAAFIDKQDYRHTEPPTAEEASSWSEALQYLAGAPGLYGSDLGGR